LKTPVAVFAFNRPRHVSVALETLSRCARLGECEVHVFCDGPRRAAEEDAVAQTRRVVRAWARGAGARVVEREANLGLARSIVGGVDALCQEHGRVIVVEDDLALRPDFLDYLLQGLERYADWSRVYQLSAYMFPVEHPPAPDAFFLPLTTTWGWATWERAWRAFDWGAEGARDLLGDPARRRAFDLDGSYPYARMLEQRIAGMNDSWGILWWLAVHRAGGLVLHPRRSLVRVGGFDGTGTHCRAARGRPGPDAGPVALPALGERIAFPEACEVDERAFTRVKRHLRRANPRGLAAIVQRARARAAGWLPGGARGGGQEC
jgi:GT2 family glycosyltransferase